MKATRHDVFALFCAGILLAAGPGLAQESARSDGGLSMNYIRVVVDNLPLGEPVSMRRLVNLPLLIGNHSAHPAPIRVCVETPPSPRPGYEPIPDPAWIELEDASPVVEGRGERGVDVVIRLPQDPALHGRRFQADLVAESPADLRAGGLAVAYRITGSLLLSVAPGPDPLALRRAIDGKVNADFSLDPPRIDLTAHAAAGPARLRPPPDQPPRLVNGSDTEQRYALRIVHPADTAVAPERGAVIGDPAQASLYPGTISLPPHGEIPIWIEILIPEGTSMAGAPQFYLAAVSQGPATNLTKYLKIYVHPAVPQRGTEEGAAGPLPPLR